MKKSEFFRPGDVAPLLGVTKARVYQLITERVIPTVRLGGSIRIPRAAWEAWLAGQSSDALRMVRSGEEARSEPDRG